MAISIIPGIIDDAEQYMIRNHVDDKALVALSGVNKYAHLLLSNGSFFKDLFTLRHPDLQQFKKAIEIITLNNPSNCYKVLCQELAGPKRTLIHPPVAFVKEAMGSKLKQLTRKNNEILGSRLGEASNHFADCCKQLRNLMSKFNTLADSLEEIHSPEEVNRLCEQLMAHSGEDLENENTFLRVHRAQFLVPRLHPKLLSTYLSLARVIEHLPLKMHALNASDQQCNQLEQECHENEKQEIDLRGTLQRLNQLENRFLSRSWNTNKTIEKQMQQVQLILDSLRGVDNFSKRREYLIKCKKCFEEIVSKGEVTEADLAAIKDAIDSNPEQAEGIWESLFIKCAKGSTEKNWARNHFPEYLDALAGIISRVLNFAEHETKYYRYSLNHSTNDKNQQRIESTVNIQDKTIVYNLIENRRKNTNGVENIVPSKCIKTKKLKA